MSSDRYFPLFANLLPFKFSRGKVKQKGRWSPSREVELINRMHYWFEDDGA